MRSYVAVLCTDLGCFKAPKPAGHRGRALSVRGPQAEQEDHEEGKGSRPEAGVIAGRHGAAVWTAAKRFGIWKRATGQYGLSFQLSNDL